MKFKRAIGKTPRSETKDEVGRIRVQVSLIEGNNPKRGNIIRQFSVEDARVSEVLAAIKESILDGK